MAHDRAIAEIHDRLEERPEGCAADDRLDPGTLGGGVTARTEAWPDECSHDRAERDEGRQPLDEERSAGLVVGGDADEADRVAEALERRQRPGGFDRL